MATERDEMVLSLKLFLTLIGTQCMVMALSKEMRLFLFAFCVLSEGKQKRAGLVRFSFCRLFK
jgi:hypothetical protein